MPEPAGSSPESRQRSSALAAGAGAAVGTLGGLIGLGGAEFRLPLLIGLFGFGALHAVILNKTMSLVVVVTALPVRLWAVPFGELAENWDVAVNLLAGSLVGAWIGASWATRLRTAVLHRVLAALLLGIAVVLFTSHQADLGAIGLSGAPLVACGVVAGAGIGVVASIMGVAGGELLIPTIVLLYGLDIKLAGSMSLAVSLPTMVVAFSRYRQDAAFAVLTEHRRFVAATAAGSLVGSVVGGGLVNVVPEGLLIPSLSAVLVVSAAKVWSHDRR